MKENKFFDLFHTLVRSAHEKFKTKKSCNLKDYRIFVVEISGIEPLTS